MTFTVDNGATVTVKDGSNGTHTAQDADNDGSVTVPGVPDIATGAGTVTVTANGHTVEVPVTVTNGSASPSDLTLHEVTVRVVEQGTAPKKTIAGAKVTIGGQAATADANGEAKLHLVVGVTYKGVQAEAAGYTPLTGGELAVQAGQVAEIELAKAGTPGVTFTVDNGATVTINGNGGTYTATAEAGKTEVKVPSVPDITTGGTVTVKATVDGQERVVTVPVTVANGVATPSDLTLHEVRVTVVEQGTATGIASATVTVGGQEATANGNGEAMLRLVKNATYAGVTASAAGYTAHTVKLEVKADGKADPARIELAKKAAGQSNPYLHVFVVDENLQAIDRVSVSVSDGDPKDKDTDPAGHVAWQLAANSEYKLTLKKEGYVTVTTSVWLEALGHDLTVVMQRVAQADPKKEDPKGQVTAVESALLAGASLYPNPAREYTTLHGLEHAEMVSILTLSGVEVQRLAVPDEREYKLDVSSLAEGIYLVALETRGGERRVLKLVVRR